MTVKLSTLKKGDIFKIVGYPADIWKVDIIYSQFPNSIQMAHIDGHPERDVNFTEFIDVIPIEKVTEYRVKELEKK